jgi:VIT1/CCC1 family predicted Fe2+/Mn2+ transporter
MAERSNKKYFGILSPMERISEVLFAVIMALTFTCTVGVGTADNLKVRTMLLAALGCNLAWGIIDACLHLMTRINDESGKIDTLRAIGDASDSGAVERILAEPLHPTLASTLSNAQLDSMRESIRRLPKLPERTGLTREDALGALGVCLLCCFSTLPIALPFVFVGDARLALRISNAVAAAMLFLCGYAFGHRGGLQPWWAAFAMVVLGGALIGVAIALGG